LPAGDTRIQPLGAFGAAAKRADLAPQPKATPTAMK
jgi:hypothetical protein